MKTALRLFLLVAMVLTVLSTVALVGALHSLSAQETVRLFVDGERVRVDLQGFWDWLALIAGLAAALFIVFLVVPLVLLFALGLSAAVSALGLAAALSPLLLMGALAWWIFRRPAPASAPYTPTQNSPHTSPATSPFAATCATSPAGPPKAPVTTAPRE